MLPAFMSWAAIVIHIPLTWILVTAYVPCLAHVIIYDSWEKCYAPVYDCLACSGAYAFSGYLLVFGNCREYHLLYYWLLITAEIIGFTLTFYVYAHKFVNYPLGGWPIVWPGFLIISFVLVVLHLLMAKKIIRNRFIRRILITFMSPTGQIG